MRKGSIIFLELKYAPAKAEIEQDRGGAAPGGAVLPAPDNATFIDAWERESTMKLLFNAREPGRGRPSVARAAGSGDPRRARV